MTYTPLFIVFISFLWCGYRFGWINAIKTIVSIIIPSILILLINIQLGRLIFRNPLIGLIIIFSINLILYKYSKPILDGINSWIDCKISHSVDSPDIVDVEVRSNEDE